MSTPELRAAWRFMLANAGWSNPPGRAACALELARADVLADALGLELWREADPDGEPGELLAELVTREGDTLAALGGIDAPASDPYYRVVRAELVRELSPEVLELLTPAADPAGERVTAGEVAAILARLRDRSWPGPATRAMIEARSALLGLVLELARAEGLER